MQQAIFSYRGVSTSLLLEALLCTTSSWKPSWITSGLPSPAPFSRQILGNEDCGPGCEAGWTQRDLSSNQVCFSPVTFLPTQLFDPN